MQVGAGCSFSGAHILQISAQCLFHLNKTGSANSSITSTFLSFSELLILFLCYTLERDVFIVKGLLPVIPPKRALNVSEICHLLTSVHHQTFLHFSINQNQTSAADF